MIKGDIFAGVKQVAVVGGSVDSSGLTSQVIRVCDVIQVGESDIMISDPSSYSPKVTIVPKGICVPIAVRSGQLSEERALNPQLGDLVMTVQRADWKEKDAKKTVGILYEIKYDLGQPVGLTLMVGSEFIQVRNESVLVLQTSQNIKKKI